MGSKGGGKGQPSARNMCISSKRPASPKEVEEGNVGGVWMVSRVDGDWKTPKKATMKMSEAPGKESSQSGSNRFRVLDGRDHDDDSEEDVFIGVVENTKRHECERSTPLKTRVRGLSSTLRRCRGHREGEEPFLHGPRRSG